MKNGDHAAVVKVLNGRYLKQQRANAKFFSELKQIKNRLSTTSARFDGIDNAIRFYANDLESHESSIFWHRLWLVVLTILTLYALFT